MTTRGTEIPSVFNIDFDAKHKFTMVQSLDFPDNMAPDVEMNMKEFPWTTVAAIGFSIEDPDAMQQKIQSQWDQNRDAGFVYTQNGQTYVARIIGTRLYPSYNPKEKDVIRFFIQVDSELLTPPPETPSTVTRS